MLAKVTILFFVVGHGSLEMRLEGGRRLVSGMLHSLYNTHVVDSGLGDIHVPHQKGFRIDYYNSMYTCMYVISSHI